MVCSQSVGIMHEIKPIAEVISDIVGEAETIARGLASED